MHAFFRDWQLPPAALLNSLYMLALPLSKQLAGLCLCLDRVALVHRWNFISAIATSRATPSCAAKSRRTLRQAKNLHRAS